MYFPDLAGTKYPPMMVVAAAATYSGTSVLFIGVDQAISSID